MIKKVVLENFQSHRHSEFEFDTGVNSLVGKTDSGKSACIRALQWVVYNKPSGNSMVSYWADTKNPCKVTLYTDTHVVSRIKSDTVNQYILDGEELNAIGQGIPEAVVEALNMSDINMQFQLDAPFLLTETSGQVARMLNKIVNLDIIDVSMKNINTYKKRINRDISALNLDIANLEAQLDAINYEYIENILDKAKTAEQQIEDIERQNASLYDNLMEAKTASEYKEREARLQEMLAVQAEIEQYIKKYDEVVLAIEDLEELIHAINACAVKINTYAPLLYVDTDAITTLFNELIELEGGIKELEYLTTVKPYTPSINVSLDVHQIDSLYATVREIAQQRDELQELLGNIADMETEIKAKEAVISQDTVLLGDTCPVCGSAL